MGHSIVASLLMFAPDLASGMAAAVKPATESFSTGGGSAVWLFANISYAGMRAQNNPSKVWRIVCFIFGFPGSLITYLTVMEGGQRAYGIDMPKRGA